MIETQAETLLERDEKLDVLIRKTTNMMGVTKGFKGRKGLLDKAKKIKRRNQRIRICVVVGGFLALLIVNFRLYFNFLLAPFSIVLVFLWVARRKMPLV